MLALHPESDADRLLLAWEGPLPRLLARVGATLFLTPFLLVPLAMVTLGGESPDAPSPSVLALTLAIWYGAVAFFAWAMGATMGTWTCLDWHGRDAAFTAHYSGRFLWLRRRVSIPFRHLTRLDVSAGAEMGAEPAALTVTFHHEAPGGKPKTRTFRFRASAINRRSEVVDFAFRLAHVLGWRGHAVTRHDHLALALTLQPSPAGAAPIPDVPADPRYAEDAADAWIAPLPEALPPPFDVTTFKGPLRPLEWKPGTRVVTKRAAMPRRSLRTALLFLTLICLIPAGVTVALAGSFELWPVLLVPAIEAPLIGLLVGMFIVRRARREETILLDWASGRLAVTGRDGSGKPLEHTAPLASIERIEVRGRRQGRARENEQPLYMCEVHAVLPGKDVLLLATGTDHTDPDVPYHIMTAAANDLARALEVQWAWQGYRATFLLDGT